jgi:hypothetical protein
MALGGSTAKLFGPVLQLPTKSVVLADATILSGLSENNMVLSDTSFNSSVEVVAVQECTLLAESMASTGHFENRRSAAAGHGAVCNRPLS